MADGDVTDGDLFLDTLQKNNGHLGNKTLREKLGWDDDRYWSAHSQLIDQGRITKGRGQGGSVVLVLPDGDAAPVIDIPQAEQERREADLYEPAKGQIESGWVRERSFDEAVVEVTGIQGRRYTGGLWTRPDIAVVAIRSFPYLPGKIFDLITFEIKKIDSINVLGVFEALSHLQFASQAYVLYCTSGQQFHDAAKDSDRILDIAKLHGVGVISAVNVNDFETWEELVEPRRSSPDPEQANLFIGTSFSEETRNRIIKWHK